MAYFKTRGGDSRGGSRFGRERAGSRSGGRPETVLYPATCAQCGKSCEVPFKPNGTKPVLCRECFGGKEGHEDRGPRHDRPRHEGPRHDTPHAHPRPHDHGPHMNELKKQIEILNSKVERLIKLLDAAADTATKE